MKTFATIASRPVRISGHPHSGWAAADPDDLLAVEVAFRFAITDDGNANYLLMYASLDKAYAADSWHSTLAQAFACAEDTFGIQEDEWSK